MPWADRVVFNSGSVVNFAIRHEGVRPDQVAVIPNGVRFREPTGVGRAVLQDTVPPDVPLIGTIGRLRPQKGHAALIEAFNRIHDQTDAHLLVIGEGELRGQLEKQARHTGLADRIHFLGVRADLPDLFAVMDIYAHSAVFEGMPNAVMEAMAAGLPVVATAADGTRQLIRDGETGWLVEPGDVGGLAERLLKVLQDKDASAAIAAAGKARMREHFSVKAMVAGFDRVYRKG